jgi:hypothetical protein
MSGVGTKILRAFVKADSGDFATDRTLELNPKLHRQLIINCDGPWYSTVKDTRRASPGSVNRHETVAGVLLKSAVILIM